MNRRTALELVGVAIAVIALVFVATRGQDDAGQPSKAAERQGKSSARGHKKKGASTGGKREAAGRTEAPAEQTEEREAANTFAAEKVLEVFGLRGRVRITDNGTVAIVLIARSDACKAVPADEARIRKFLLDAAPTLREVIVEVAGTGQSLAEYVRAHCEKTKFPGGPGETVYRQKGEGFQLSKPFRVRGPKWAIDYEAQGAGVYMLVFKGKKRKVVAPGVAKKKRGVGTQEFEGKGRYVIDIRGSGFWKLRVRDGA